MPMFKTDERLRYDVLDELRWDPRTRAAAVGVTVVNGVVSISGEVATEAEKRAIVSAVERVSAVRALAEHIVVKIPGSLRRTDSDIARDVARVLDSIGDVPETVKARVENGWLWLEGSVDWPYQRLVAERVLFDRETQIAGLRGISNDIVVARPAMLPATLEHETTLLSQ
jgi:hypothetical protein